MDRLIVYTIVSEVRRFQRDYGFIIGGGTVSEELRLKGRKHSQSLLQLLSQFDQDISSNYQALSPQAAKQYQLLAKQLANISAQFMPQLVKIGKLQLLRKLVVRQINFAAKVECQKYTACLETVNRCMLNNLVEIKENAARAYLERSSADIAALIYNRESDDPPELTTAQALVKEEKEEESGKVLREFMKDMTVCLEFVGHVKPQNKVYNLTRDLHHMPLVFCLVTLNALQYLRYDSSVFSLVRARKEMVIDGPHFITGLLTIFK